MTGFRGWWADEEEKQDPWDRWAAQLGLPPTPATAAPAADPWDSWAKQLGLPDPGSTPPLGNDVADVPWEDRFNTQLEPVQEQQFQSWLEEGRQRYGVDLAPDLRTYDLRGYWAAGGAEDEAFRQRQGHAPDTYKKPNHPTFSVESAYNQAPNAEGGYYVGGTWGPDDTFTPPTPDELRAALPDSWEKRWVDESLKEGGFKGWLARLEVSTSSVADQLAAGVTAFSERFEDMLTAAPVVPGVAGWEAYATLGRLGAETAQYVADTWLPASEAEAGVQPWHLPPSYANLKDGRYSSTLWEDPSKIFDWDFTGALLADVSAQQIPVFAATALSAVAATAVSANPIVGTATGIATAAMLEGGGARMDTLRELGIRAEDLDDADPEVIRAVADANTRAVWTGLINGLLEYAPIGWLGASLRASKRAGVTRGLLGDVEKLAKGADDFLEAAQQNVIKEVGKRSSEELGRLTAGAIRVALGLGEQGLAEGTTEMVQEIVSTATRKAYDDNQSYYDAIFNPNIVEAGFLGMIAGAGMSTGPSFMNAVRGDINYRREQAFRKAMQQAGAQRLGEDLDRQHPELAERRMFQEAQQATLSPELQARSAAADAALPDLGDGSSWMRERVDGAKRFVDGFIERLVKSAPPAPTVPAVETAAAEAPAAAVPAEEQPVVRPEWLQTLEQAAQDAGYTAAEAAKLRERASKSELEFEAVRREVEARRSPPQPEATPPQEPPPVPVVASQLAEDQLNELRRLSSLAGRDAAVTERIVQGLLSAPADQQAARYAQTIAAITLAAEKRGVDLSGQQAVAPAPEKPDLPTEGEMTGLRKRAEERGIPASMVERGKESRGTYQRIMAYVMSRPVVEKPTVESVVQEAGGAKLTDATLALWRTQPQEVRSRLNRHGIVSNKKGRPLEELVGLIQERIPDTTITTPDELMAHLMGQPPAAMPTEAAPQPSTTVQPRWSFVVGRGLRPAHEDLPSRGFTRAMTPAEYRSLLPAEEKSQGAEEAAHYMRSGAAMAPAVLDADWDERAGAWRVTGSYANENVDAASLVDPTAVMPVYVRTKRSGPVHITPEMRFAPFIRQGSQKPQPTILTTPADALAPTRWERARIGTLRQELEEVIRPKAKPVPPAEMAQPAEMTPPLAPTVTVDQGAVTPPPAAPVTAPKVEPEQETVSVPTVTPAVAPRATAEVGAVSSPAVAPVSAPKAELEPLQRSLVDTANSRALGVEVAQAGVRDSGLESDLDDDGREVWQLPPRSGKTYWTRTFDPSSTRVSVVPSDLRLFTVEGEDQDQVEARNTLRSIYDVPRTMPITSAPFARVVRPAVFERTDGTPPAWRLVERGQLELLQPEAAAEQPQWRIMPPAQQATGEPGVGTPIGPRYDQSEPEGAALAALLRNIRGVDVAPESVGIVHPDDPVLANEQAHAASLFANGYNHRVIFVRFKKGAAQPFNGAYHLGNIFINVESQNPFMAVVGHELIHAMKDDAPDIAKRLITVLQQSNPDALERYRQVVSLRRSVPGEKVEGPIDWTDEDYLEELAGDILGEEAVRPEFIQAIKQHDASLLDRFLEFINDSLARFRAVVNPDFRVERILTDLTTVQTQLQEAMREYGGRVTQTQEATGEEALAEGQVKLSMATKTYERERALDETRRAKGKPTRVTPYIDAWVTAQQTVREVQKSGNPDQPGFSEWIAKQRPGFKTADVENWQRFFDEHPEQREKVKALADSIGSSVFEDDGVTLRATPIERLTKGDLNWERNRALYLAIPEYAQPVTGTKLLRDTFVQEESVKRWQKAIIGVKEKVDEHEDDAEPPPSREESLAKAGQFLADYSVTPTGNWEADLKEAIEKQRTVVRTALYDYYNRNAANRTGLPGNPAPKSNAAIDTIAKWVSSELGIDQPAFPGFRRDLQQMLFDNMPHDRREEVRKFFYQSTRDAWVSGKGEELDWFIIDKKRKSFTDPLKARHMLDRVFDFSDLATSPLRGAQKTVASLNGNVACPMFILGNNSCWNMACYITAMGVGNGMRYYQHAPYSGELLQVPDSIISVLNQIGGLRINGAGDITPDTQAQLTDILRDAKDRGLKVKVITKQHDTFGAVQQALDTLRAERKNRNLNFKNVVIQPSMDFLWVPVRDDLKNPGSGLASYYGSPERAMEMLEKQPQAVAEAIRRIYNRETRMMKGRDGKVQLMRKYGFSPEQVQQLIQQHPDLRIVPRWVVTTPEEIAEAALRSPKSIYTFMHGIVGSNMVSELPGGGLVNFTDNRHRIRDGRLVPERAREGEAELPSGQLLSIQGARHGKGDKVAGGESGIAAYAAVNDFIYRSRKADGTLRYTPQQIRQIYRSLRRGTCCQENDSPDACFACATHCVLQNSTSVLDGPVLQPENADVEARAFALEGGETGGLESTPGIRGEMGTQSEGQPHRDPLMLALDELESIQGLTDEERGEFDAELREYPHRVDETLEMAHAFVAQKAHQPIPEQAPAPPAGPPRHQEAAYTEVREEAAKLQWNPMRAETLRATGTGTRALAINIQKRLEERRAFDPIGMRVECGHDAMKIAQPLRDPRIEHSMMLVVGANSRRVVDYEIVSASNPVTTGEVFHSLSRVPASLRAAATDPTLPLDQQNAAERIITTRNLTRLRDRLGRIVRRVGEPVEVYMIHNHPSHSTPSDADVEVAWRDMLTFNSLIRTGGLEKIRAKTEAQLAHPEVGRKPPEEEGGKKKAPARVDVHFSGSYSIGATEYSVVLPMGTKKEDLAVGRFQLSDLYDKTGSLIYAEGMPLSEGRGQVTYPPGMNQRLVGAVVWAGLKTDPVFFAQQGTLNEEGDPEVPREMLGKSMLEEPQEFAAVAKALSPQVPSVTLIALGPDSRVRAVGAMTMADYMAQDVEGYLANKTRDWGAHRIVGVYEGPISQEFRDQTSMLVAAGRLSMVYMEGNVPGVEQLQQQERESLSAAGVREPDDYLLKLRAEAAQAAMQSPIGNLDRAVRLSHGVPTFRTRWGGRRRPTPGPISQQEPTDEYLDALIASEAEIENVVPRDRARSTSYTNVQEEAAKLQWNPARGVTMAATGTGTRAIAFDVQQALQEHRRFDPTGYTVKSAHDVAKLLQPLRDPRIEHSHMVVVGKNSGEVLSIQSASSYAPSWTREVFDAGASVNDNYETPDDMDARLERLARVASHIRRTAQVEGEPVVVYSSHNHPEGFAKPSPGDVEGVAWLRDELADIAPEVTYGGEVVLGVGQYAIVPAGTRGALPNRVGRGGAIFNEDGERISEEEALELRNEDVRNDISMGRAVVAEGVANANELRQAVSQRVGEENWIDSGVQRQVATIGRDLLDSSKYVTVAGVSYEGNVKAVGQIAVKEWLGGNAEGWLRNRGRDWGSDYLYAYYDGNQATEVAARAQGLLDAEVLSGMITLPAADAGGPPSVIGDNREISYAPGGRARTFGKRERIPYFPEEEPRALLQSAPGHSMSAEEWDKLLTDVYSTEPQPSLAQSELMAAGLPVEPEPVDFAETEDQKLRAYPKKAGERDVPPGTAGNYAYEVKHDEDMKRLARAKLYTNGVLDRTAVAQETVNLLDDRIPATAESTVLGQALLVIHQEDFRSYRRAADVAMQNGQRDVAQAMVEKAQQSLNLAQALANDYMRKATNAGQVASASRLLSMLDPDTIWAFALVRQEKANKLAAERGSKERVEFSEAQLDRLRQLAETADAWNQLNAVTSGAAGVITKIYDKQKLSQEDLAELRRFVGDIHGLIPPEAAPTRRRAETLDEASRRIAAEAGAAARQRLAATFGAKKGAAKLQAVFQTHTARDLAILGSELVSRGLHAFDKWNDQMLVELDAFEDPTLKQRFPEAAPEIFRDARRRYALGQRMAAKTRLQAKQASELIAKLSTQYQISDTSERLPQGEEATIQGALKDVRALASLLDQLKSSSGRNQQLLTAQIQSEFDQLRDPNMWELISTLQYIGHLSNTVTHMRNILGNEAFYRLERAQHYVTALADLVRSSVPGASPRRVHFRRGNQHFHWGNFFKEAATFDFAGVKAEVARSPFWQGLGEGASMGWQGLRYGDLTTKYGLTPGIKFRGKGWMQRAYERVTDTDHQHHVNLIGYAERATGAALVGFDYAAFQRAVTDFLGEHAELEADQRGLEGEARDAFLEHFVVNADDMLMEQAHEYGKYMTFQDESLPARFFSGFKGVLNIVGAGAPQDKRTGTMQDRMRNAFGLGDLFMKYPKTPGNLLDRSLRYSPFGAIYFLHELRAGARAGRVVNRVTNRQLLNDEVPPMDVRRVEESLTRALMGFGGMAGAYLLYGAGVLTGEPPDDPDAAAFLANEVPRTSVNASAVWRWAHSGFDKSQWELRDGDVFYSFDWLAPLGVNLASATFAAQSVEERRQGKSVAKEWDDLASMGVVGAWRAYSTLSVMSGLKELSGGPRSTKEIPEAAWAELQSLPSQFVSNTVRQVRYLTDPYMRITRIGNTLPSRTPAGKRYGKVLGMVMDKIPIASESLPVAYRTLGYDARAKRYPTDVGKGWQETLATFAQVFLSPGKVAVYNPLFEASTTMLVTPYMVQGKTQQFPWKAETKLQIPKGVLNEWYVPYTGGTRMFLEGVQGIDLQPDQLSALQDQAARETAILLAEHTTPGTVYHRVAEPEPGQRPGVRLAGDREMRESDEEVTFEALTDAERHGVLCDVMDQGRRRALLWFCQTELPDYLEKGLGSDLIWDVPEEQQEKVRKDYGLD